MLEDLQRPEEPDTETEPVPRYKRPGRVAEIVLVARLVAWAAHLGPFNNDTPPLPGDAVTDYCYGSRGVSEPC